MSEFRLSFPACVVAGKTRLSVEDLLLLRRYTFPEGVRTPDDVVTLLALNTCCPEKCPEWADYFIEQLAGFLVDRCYPIGSLDEINVEWVKCVLSNDGVIEGELEFAAILHMMEIARHVPPSLGMLMLDQLRIALDEERGAYARRRALQAGIGADDIAYVHRILRDRLGSGAPLLSPAKIAILETIDRETATHARHPDWQPLIDTILSLRGRTQARTETPRRWLHVPDSFFLDAEMVA
ncbi:hypothetical protein [Ciceribacter selenitireducens]|uniref:hypothetical protein n=1 Tax=Ciceribacter selenitireducens TaxID=448181 RepID=UPI00048D845D|nr:hypothetical protein [Ciceribacter selenitireducens]